MHLKLATFLHSQIHYSSFGHAQNEKGFYYTLCENLWRVADKLVENGKSMFIYRPIGLTCLHMFQYILTYWGHIVFTNSLWVENINIGAHHAKKEFKD